MNNNNDNNNERRGKRTQKYNKHNFQMEHLCIAANKRKKKLRNVAVAVAMAVPDLISLHFSTEMKTSQ